MTVTNIVSSVSAGTGSNIGGFFNPVKTALQAATTTLKCNFRATFTTLPGANASAVLRLWQAVSTVSYGSATLGAQALVQGGLYTDIKLAYLASTDAEVPSDLLITGAGYHYCWFDMPTLTVACSLNVYLQEFP